MQRVPLLLALALALVVLAATAALATAAPPPVEGEAYFVQNSATGEVLARFDEREQLPVASLTKLMTALVALERADLDEVVTVAARRRGRRRVLDPPPPRRARHDARPAPRGARPERERRRHRGRPARRPGLRRALRRADERQGACTRAHRHRLREPDGPRRARPRLERPRRHEARPRRDEPAVRARDRPDRDR